MQKTRWVLFLTVATALDATAADDTAVRIGRAMAVLHATADSEHGLRAEQIASADCIAVIPGFKKGAAVVGVGYGRGFISCRKASDWSTPGAVTLESGSLGVQTGGEKIDNIVILSLDKGQRSKLFSDRFRIGSDASAAWEMASRRTTTPTQRSFSSARLRGAFAGFGLDGASLKEDESGNEALYGTPLNNTEIVEGGAATPAVAQPLIATLVRESSR